MLYMYLYIENAYKRTEVWSQSESTHGENLPLK